MGASFEFFYDEKPSKKFVEKAELKQEEITVLLLPFLNKLSKSELPLYLLTRLETRLSGWSEAGARTQSMGLLRMKKIKKHNNFSVLVNDDNLNSLQVFQKLNSKFQVHFGQSFTNSLDVFRSFLENGFNYDLVFIDLTGKTINGIELMKNVRGIEKIANAFASHIVGILDKKEGGPIGLDEKGIDKYIYRPLDENMIMNIIKNLDSNLNF